MYIKKPNMNAVRLKCSTYIMYIYNVYRTIIGSCIYHVKSKGKKVHEDFWLVLVLLSLCVCIFTKCFMDQL